MFFKARLQSFRKNSPWEERSEGTSQIRLKQLAKPATEQTGTACGPFLPLPGRTILSSQKFEWELSVGKGKTSVDEIRKGNKILND